VAPPSLCPMITRMPLSRPSSSAYFTILL
jgi:hypothetical protein